MTSFPLLTPDEIHAYHEHGYLRLPAAFPREAALSMQAFMWQQLETHSGILQHDRSTWTRAVGGFSKTRSHPVYQAIGNPRLCGAIDQLLGAGTWFVPGNWGAFLVSFPEPADHAWTIPTRLQLGWHVDHDPLFSIFGVRIFMFFSSVTPQGGGTLIVAGSHRLIERYRLKFSAQEHEKPCGGYNEFLVQSHPWMAMLNGKIPGPSDRVQYFMHTPADIEGVSVRVVELTGEPGDAYLCHPLIYHARSYHHENQSRFMRTRTILKKR